MPLISVIIPVYKVEEYLEKCVASILQQDFHDYEIILVDDGSPDNCPEICEVLANQHDNVKVIHKENGGLSSARNVGVANASGKFLIYVDSDDYWEPSSSLKSIADLASKNPDIDVIMMGFKRLNVLNGKMKTHKIYSRAERYFLENNSKEDVISHLFASNLNPTSAWSVITRRDFIIENNIYFEHGIIAEDVDWIIQLFISAKSFSAISDVFYVYLKNRGGSLSNTSGKRGVESILFILDKWVPILKDRSDILSTHFLKFLSFHYSTVFLTFAYLNKDDKALFEERLKSYFFLFNNLKVKKVKLVKFLLLTFGFNFGSKLLRMIYHGYKRY